MPKNSPRARSAYPTDALVRALMADALHGALLLDPQGRLADANAAAERLLGFTLARARGKELATLLRSVVSGDDLARELYRRTRTEREAVLHTSGAGEVQVVLRGYRLGRPPWLLVTLQDLTSVLRMQQ